MRGLNKVIIAGNLAREPEVRYTVNKRVYARFSVAVNYRYKDPASGEYKDGVDYVPVVVWGVHAENCGKYLKKGSPVLLEGRVQTSSYEARDGSGKRYSTEINADNIIFLGSGQQSSGGGYSKPAAADFGAMPPYVPSDDDFGKSIGESGFGGGFPQNFADNGFADNNSGNSNNNDHMPESDLPF